MLANIVTNVFPLPNCKESRANPYWRKTICLQTLWQKEQEINYGINQIDFAWFTHTALDKESLKHHYETIHDGEKIPGEERLWILKIWFQKSTNVFIVIKFTIGTFTCKINSWKRRNYPQIYCVPCENKRTPTSEKPYSSQYWDEKPIAKRYPSENSDASGIPK